MRVLCPACLYMHMYSLLHVKSTRTTHTLTRKRMCQMREQFATCPGTLLRSDLLLSSFLVPLTYILFSLSFSLSSEFVCLQPILLSWLYPHCSEGRTGGRHSWRLCRHFQGEGLQWPRITALNCGNQRWQYNCSLCKMICSLCWVASACLYLDVVRFRKNMIINPLMHEILNHKKQVRFKNKNVINVFYK